MHCISTPIRFFQCAALMFAVVLFSTLPVRAVMGAAPDLRRPVCQLDKETVTLQWYTAEKCPTKIQLREGGIPCNTPQPAGKTYTPWQSETAMEIYGDAKPKNYHRLAIGCLKPSTRYYYRVFDPATEPTGEERNWGAEKPWRRERAFSTLAVKGERTVIRVPVKVLIMPNVVNVSSAYDRTTGEWAPPPPVMTAADIAKIKKQYETATRFYFINNGFRVWHDFQIVVDPRWQRWGIDYSNAPAFYRSLPPSRSWAGVDYTGPGGGAFTPVDTGSIDTPGEYPLFEKELYIGQIENAFLRRYNQKEQKWEFVRSGGGTLGIDGWHQGIPGRSQYLGDDVAWLACHEYHHQIESQGHWGGLNREDDRVIFDHFAGRYRIKRETGTWDEFTWDTTGKFGEHWSGIAHTDRSLSDMQWLRWYFGETIAVRDKDCDSVPDNDPRLPFDEARFGSSPRKTMTDGEIADFDKIRLSIWSPGPLQSMWTRPERVQIMPKPCTQDSDGDGRIDSLDPAPLIPYPPFIWPAAVQLDGDSTDWQDIPAGGRIATCGMNILFKQSHSDDAYYGLLVITGDWRDVRVTLDGEADGVYGPGIGGFGGSSDGYWLTFRRSADEKVPVSVTVTSQGGGFTSRVARVEGTTVIEFSIPNRGDSTWYWRDGGREVGVSIDAGNQTGQRLSMFDGYDPLFSIMLPLYGKKVPTVTAPPELSAAEAKWGFDFSQPKARDAWKFEGPGWTVRDGAMQYDGKDETAMYLEGFTTTNFTVWVEFEAERDMIIGAYSAGAQKMDAGHDYVAFMGGYENTISKIRLEGQGEVCGDHVGIEPGKHTMQFTRRGPYFFMQYDNKLIGWFKDAEAPKAITRLAICGFPGANEKIYQVKVALD